MIRPLALLMLLVMTVTACGQLPRPFGRDGATDANPLADTLYWEGVEVPPLTGTTPPMGRLLARAVASELEKTYQIPAAITGLDRSQYLLDGHVNIARSGVLDLPRYSITWTLKERRGGTVAEFTEEISASQFEWDYGSPAIIRRVGESIGLRVAKLALGERFNTAGQDRFLGREGVYVTAVNGAPGDGNTSLRRAMTVALGGGGLQLANDPASALFTVGADVAVGAPENGAQSVSIVWTVRDIEGSAIGTAEQANAVPAGSLDGVWGQTAAFAAAAASDGIIGIIAPVNQRRFSVPDLGSGPHRRGGPPPASLPQIPGRAPPPPS